MKKQGGGELSEPEPEPEPETKIDTKEVKIPKTKAERKEERRRIAQNGKELYAKWARENESALEK